MTTSAALCMVVLTAQFAALIFAIFALINTKNNIEKPRNLALVLLDKKYFNEYGEFYRKAFTLVISVSVICDIILFAITA